MNKIVFATNNKHKLEEIRSILGEGFEVLSLSDIGCHEDIPETSDTLEGNAMQKAQYVFDLKWKPSVESLVSTVPAMLRLTVMIPSAMTQKLI